MSCLRDLKDSDLVLDYCAGALDAGQAAEFERHMAECGDCTRIVAAQREVWESLDCFSAPEVSHDFDVRLYARIAQQEAAPIWRKWLRRIAQPATPAVATFPWKPALSMAALCGVLVAGFMVGHSPTPGPLAPAGGLAIHSDQVDIEQVANALDELDLLMPGSPGTPAAQAPHSAI